jgi:nitroimidazol reductase NimA-like FMN-containing flavoprotein (pyridoxamine 5'-phosphate oxidase superfamily)
MNREEFARCLCADRRFRSEQAFHGAVSGGSKYGNIVGNGKVCFTVVGRIDVMPEKFSTLFESVIVFGEAVLVSDEK